MVLNSKEVFTQINAKNIKNCFARFMTSDYNLISRTVYKATDECICENLSKSMLRLILSYTWLIMKLFELLHETYFSVILYIKTFHYIKFWSELRSFYPIPVW